MRRHEALTQFLVRVLSVDPAAAGRNACHMEHAIEPQVLENLVKFLRFLESCPGPPVAGGAVSKTSAGTARIPRNAAAASAWSRLKSRARPEPRKGRSRGKQYDSRIRHKAPAGPEPAASVRRLVVLVGSPNVGKSLLFNRLTGAYAVVSNYPGTTVEITQGKARIGEQEWEVADTPGMYSLLPNSEEERVGRAMLLFAEKPNAVLQVVDAKNLERMLAFTLQPPRGRAAADPRPQHHGRGREARNPD